MKIAICSDHGGYELKEYLKKTLKEYEIKDLGCFSKERCNHVEYAFKLSEYVVKEDLLGIAICKSGIGMSIACNKVKGIRCAKVNNVKEAIVTREDNNANVIAISGKMCKRKALKIIKAFINTSFKNTEPYISRVKQVDEYIK